jgi:hypothetical protein
MANIDEKVIQELLNQINELRTTIDKAGAKGRTKLHGIKAKVDEAVKKVTLVSGKVDANNWSQLTEDQQNAIHQDLVKARDSLHNIAKTNGPSNPKHIMYEEYASNASICAWAFLSFLLTLFLLYEISTNWNEATGMGFATKIQDTITAIDKHDAAVDKATKAKEAESKAQLALTSTEEGKNGQEGPTKNASAKTDKADKSPNPTNITIVKSEKDPNQVSPSTPEAGSATNQVKSAEAEVKKAAEQVKVTQAEVKKASEQVDLAMAKAIEALREDAITEGTVLYMVILTGALGGSLHLLRSLVIFVGNRQLMRSWLLYYMSMPVTGAGLASVVYMMLRVGLIGPSGGSSDGSSISNMNLIGIYASTALTGLFSARALGKLSDVFKTMFGAEDSRDALKT